MARNRKRRNDRRPRRPGDAEASRPGTATARTGRDDAPDPIAHATPDVELAEAQLAVGRPELPATPGDDHDDGDIDGGDFDGAGGGGADAGGDDFGADAGGSGPGGGGLARSGSSAPTPHAGGRLVHFLQGSWRELQRVQWPDRRQVIQATGVVIGFVIVAGLFLGVADFVAGKIVHYILQ